MIGLMATVQFLTIKYGRKKVSNCKVLPVFAVLVILSIVLTIVENAVDITDSAALRFADRSAQLVLLPTPLL